MDLFKFPRTPHLFVVPGLDIRDDKVLSDLECESLLKNPIILEEKLDGANIGISLSENNELQIQNRGNYIFPGSHPQFDRLWKWAYSKISRLTEHIGSDLIVFGEWCYAKHSIHYTSLPDWLVGFDIYDKRSKTFLNTELRNQIFNKIGIEIISTLGKGIYSKMELVKLLNGSKSRFYDGPVEGIYVRYEDQEKLIRRAKIVNKDFIQEIDIHWSKKELMTNQLLK